MEPNEILNHKIRKIFKDQLSVLGITILLCIGAAVGIGFLLSLTLDLGDGLGVLVVMVYGAIALGVLFIVEFLGLGIWGLIRAMMIRKSNPQVFRGILLGKVSVAFSLLLVLSSLVAVFYAGYTLYHAFY